jgi:hypothetical protein
MYGAAKLSWGLHHCIKGAPLKPLVAAPLQGFHPKDKSQSTLTEILAEFDRLGKPHYHLIGKCQAALPLLRAPRSSAQTSPAPFAFSPHREPLPVQLGETGAERKVG